MILVENRYTPNQLTSISIVAIVDPWHALANATFKRASRTRSSTRTASIAAALARTPAASRPATSPLTPRVPRSTSAIRSTSRSAPSPRSAGCAGSTCTLRFATRCAPCSPRSNEFRIVHLSVQNTHVHLLVEANDKRRARERHARVPDLGREGDQHGVFAPPSVAAAPVRARVRRSLLHRGHRLGAPGSQHAVVRAQQLAPALATTPARTRCSKAGSIRTRVGSRSRVGAKRFPRTNGRCRATTNRRKSAQPRHGC